MIISDITIPTRLVQSGQNCDYFVTDGTIRVRSELFIDPGVVVIFDQDTRLLIDNAGSITAVGTPEERIVLAGQLNVRGHWYGLCFGNNRESRLEYVDLLRAGKVWGTGSQAVCRAAIGGVSRNGEPVHVKHSFIAGALTTGLDATRVPVGEFENNVFAANTEFGVRAYAPMLHRLDAASDYLGTSVDALNGRPYIFVPGFGEPEVDEDEMAVWRNLNADYYLENDFPYFRNVIVRRGRIEIEPGTRFVVASHDSGINFWEDSIVSAIGTLDAPIVFTALNERPGSWRGIGLQDSGGVFEHVEVRYGDPATLSPANIYVSGNPRFFTDIRNSVIMGSADCGIRDNTRKPRAVRQSGNTFSDNQRDLCGVEE